MAARSAGIQELGMVEYFGVALLCACSGCWEKIEYTGPDLSAAAESQSPAVNVASSEQPIASSSDSDAVAIHSDTPVSDQAASGEMPSDEPPANDVTAAPEAADASGDRYATLPAPETPAIEESPNSNPAASSEVSPETPAAQISVASPAVPNPVNTRRTAWELGSKLSIVALANDRGITEHVPTWAREASAAAKVLGVKLAKLPERPATGDPNELASKQVLNYLFVQGQELGRLLATRYGPDHAALLEVAVKSNLLVLLYQPGSSTAETIASALSQAAPRAKLPVELWQPLVDLLKTQAPLSDVRVAVRKLHADVDQYLAKSAESDVR